jgi:hypothetical protein
MMVKRTKLERRLGNLLLSFIGGLSSQFLDSRYEIKSFVDS